MQDFDSFPEETVKARRRTDVSFPLENGCAGEWFEMKSNRMTFVCECAYFVIILRCTFLFLKKTLVKNIL